MKTWVQRSSVARREQAESKNDKGDFDKTAYALNVAKEALEEAESSLASATRVIQCAAEAIKSATVAVEAAKQGSDLSQQGDEKARASGSVADSCEDSEDDSSEYDIRHMEYMVALGNGDLPDSSDESAFFDEDYDLSAICENDDFAYAVQERVLNGIMTVCEANKVLAERGLPSVTHDVQNRRI